VQLRKCDVESNGGSTGGGKKKNEEIREGVGTAGVSGPKWGEHGRVGVGGEGRARECRVLAQSEPKVQVKTGSEGKGT